MRARFGSVSWSQRWVEVLAVIAGAAVVVVVVLVVRESGRSDRPDASRRPRARLRAAAGAPSTGRPRSLAPVHSPGGAVDAVTAYLVLLARAVAIDGAGARRAVGAMTVGRLRAELEQGLPALTGALQSRLRSARVPAAFYGWPLGYRLTAVSRYAATVSVWHLDLAASSTLGLMTTDYATTTYVVRWVGGTWRIARASNVAGPTPPPPDASRADVDRFAAAVRQFSAYSYVP